MFLWTCHWSYGQSFGKNIHKIEVYSLPSTYTNDLTIIPSSVLFQQANGSPIEVDFTLENNRIEITDQQTSVPFYLIYRTFPFNFNETHSLYSSSAINSTGYAKRDYQSKEATALSSLFGTEGIEYTGSFGRSVSVGNAQSLVMNSNLNLQLHGQLTDELEISAAISDQSLPIQPDGNTQQLQEFDKVFIQLKSPRHTLIAGDFILQNPKGYFIQHEKKLSGLSYLTNQTLNDKWSVRNSTSAAISKGQYVRQTLSSSEGNQGPYQLVGNEGEQFVIVLAGTERIYLNDQLLNRGADKDYTIDYNLGQVTFTPNILVTKDSRLIVEFEYINQAFGTSFASTGTEIFSDKTSIYLNFSHLQDSKNPSGGFDLDSNNIMTFQNAGDQTQGLAGSGIRKASTDEFDGRVIYQKRDTTYVSQGITTDTTILSYASRPNETNAYVARFRFVGHQKGNYQLMPSTMNGRVYQWVAPDPITGTPQGEYEPQISLNAPESRQNLNLGFSSEAIKNLKISSEVALSRTDLNRLSDIDDQDNIGLAGTASAEHSIVIGQKGWQWVSSGRIEWNDHQFNTIEPYRNQEFQRDWGRQFNDRTQELLGEISGGIQKKSGEKLIYRYHNYRRQDGYFGGRHLMNIDLRPNGWHISGNPQYTTSESALGPIVFARPNLSISRQFSNFGQLQVKMSYDAEMHESKDTSFTPNINNYRYNSGKIAVSSTPLNGIKSELNYSFRQDDVLHQKEWTTSSNAHNFGINTSINTIKQFQIDLRLAYRSLNVTQPALAGEHSLSSLVGQLGTRFKWFRGFIQGHTLYELSNGQTPKLEYTYEERRPGEGQYIHEDLNGDGATQLNEFIHAPFSDTARYVRIPLFNNDFIRTQNLKFSQNLQLKPSQLWKEEAPDWIKRLHWTSVIKSEQRLEQSDIEINPLLSSLQDSTVIFAHRSLQHNLYINRGHRKWDIQLSQRKRLLVSQSIVGHETQDQNEFISRVRINLWTTHDLILNTQWGEAYSNSEQFADRFYLIQSTTFNPEWNSVINRKIRIKGQYAWLVKKNIAIETGEQTRQLLLSLEVQYRNSQTSSLRATLETVKVNHQSLGNVFIDYAMLEALRNGSNYRWQMSWDRMLFQNFQLSLSYQGRKNGIGKVLHSGQVAIKATF